MSDAPLPEALTQMIGRADDIVARNMGAREPWCVELRNLFAEMVAFRGVHKPKECPSCGGMGTVWSSPDYIIPCGDPWHES